MFSVILLGIIRGSDIGIATGQTKYQKFLTVVAFPTIFVINPKEKYYMRLSTKGSARRLARMWVDLNDNRRKELLDTLDTEARIEVIENMLKIKTERKEKNV
jgi:hypothetical protein